MQSFLMMLLPAAIKLIAYLAERKMLDQKQKDAFVDFVKTMSEGVNTSKEARDEFDELDRKLRGEKSN